MHVRVYSKIIRGTFRITVLKWCGTTAMATCQANHLSQSEKDNATQTKHVPCLKRTTWNLPIKQVPCSCSALTVVPSPLLGGRSISGHSFVLFQQFEWRTRSARTRATRSSAARKDWSRNWNTTTQIPISCWKAQPSVCWGASSWWLRRTSQTASLCMDTVKFLVVSSHGRTYSHMFSRSPSSAILQTSPKPPTLSEPCNARYRSCIQRIPNLLGSPVRTPV